MSVRVCAHIVCACMCVLQQWNTTEIKVTPGENTEQLSGFLFQALVGSNIALCIVLTARNAF